jgi:transcriptional regulator with XRE-family HTH domain
MLKKSASAFAVPNNETTSSVRIPSLKHTGNYKSSILKGFPGNMLLMTPGARVREAMEAAGLKAKDLAGACHVSESAVSQWLADLTKPSAENIFAIGDATGYSPRWLATEKGIKRAPKTLAVLDGGKSDKSGQTNPDLLTQAIEIVEEALRLERKVYPSSAKARMVWGIYDLALKSGSIDADTVKTILRLVS